MNEAIESNKLMRMMGQGRPRSCTGSETSFVKQCEGYFVNILAGILVPAIIEQNNLISFVSRILPADLGSEPEDQDCFKKAQTIFWDKDTASKLPCGHLVGVKTCLKTANPALFVAGRSTLDQLSTHIWMIRN